MYIFSFSTFCNLFIASKQGSTSIYDSISNPPHRTETYDNFFCRIHILLLCKKDKVTNNIFTSRNIYSERKINLAYISSATTQKRPHSPWTIKGTFEQKGCSIFYNHLNIPPGKRPVPKNIDQIEVTQKKKQTKKPSLGGIWFSN